MRAHYLQHVPFEGLGSIESWLRSARWEITHTRLFESVEFPDPARMDLLVIMETDLPAHKRAAPIRLQLRPAPCPLDIVVCTPGEVAYWDGTANHIITEALRTGKVLYGRP